MGILRRAKQREKELPPQLETALKIQAELIEPYNEVRKLKSYHINQRHETIDLDEISGALMTQRNLQMETFITEPTNKGFDGHAAAVTGDVSSTLGTNCGQSTGRQGIFAPVFPVLMDQGGERMNVEDNKVGTLRASMGGNLPVIMQKENQHVYENHAKDSRYTGPLNVAPTISATYGTGGNNVPFVTNALAFGIESQCFETSTSHTLDTANPNPNKSQGGLAIIQPRESYCIAANTINREAKNGGNGLGCQTDISYTLTTSDVHSVYLPEMYQDKVGALMHRDHKGVNSCYVNQDKLLITPYQDKVGALCHGDEKGVNNQYVSSDKCIIESNVFGQSSYGGYDSDVSTLTASGGYLGGGSENLAVSRNLVRRLTPLECERLQGFPDNWTNISKSSDSARYKALGNSVAIPCVNFVIKGIAYFLKKQYEGE